MKAIAIGLLAAGCAAIGLQATGLHIKDLLIDRLQPQLAPTQPTNPNTTPLPPTSPSPNLSTSPVLTQAQITENTMSAQIVTAHNQYRQALNLPPLKWSERLSSNAQEWALYLAEQGRLQHAENTGEGENLWAGTTGAFTLTQMVDAWGDEKQHFKNGTFPDVSTTGNWSDVGHYTQMIWRDTEQVGCAIASNNGNDVLVCRYSPPGNSRGQSVY